jgi:hypothetical protein
LLRIYGPAGLHEGYTPNDGILKLDVFASTYGDGLEMLVALTEKKRENNFLIGRTTTSSR